MKSTELMSLFVSLVTVVCCYCNFLTNQLELGPQLKIDKCSQERNRRTIDGGRTIF